MEKRARARAFRVELLVTVRTVAGAGDCSSSGAPRRSFLFHA